MKRNISAFLVITLTVLSFISPSVVFAGEHISAEDDISNEDLIEIASYDVETQTTTTRTVSISALQQKNDVTKERLGLSGQNVMQGYQPPNAQTNVATTASTTNNENEPVDVTQDPYDSVMFLDLKFDLDNDGEYDLQSSATASGFLVGHNVMLTAAHCFYTYIPLDAIDLAKRNDLEAGYYWVDQCRIYPQQDSAQISADEDDYYYARSWHYSTVYLDTSRNALNRFEHDWLIVTLFTPLGSEYGYFGIHDPDLSLENSTVKVAGYPAQTVSKRYRQYCVSGVIQNNLEQINPEYCEKLIDYSNATEPGTSGGPVYLEIVFQVPPLAPLIYRGVVGINVGAAYDPWTNVQAFAIGRRITGDMYTILEEYILESEEQYG